MKVEEGKKRVGKYGERYEFPVDKVSSLSFIQVHVYFHPLFLDN